MRGGLCGGVVMWGDLCSVSNDFEWISRPRVVRSLPPIFIRLQSGGEVPLPAVDEQLHHPTVSGAHAVVEQRVGKMDGGAPAPASPMFPRRLQTTCQQPVVPAQISRQLEHARPVRCDDLRAPRRSPVGSRRSPHRFHPNPSVGDARQVASLMDLDSVLARRSCSKYLRPALCTKLYKVLTRFPQALVFSRTVYACRTNCLPPRAHKTP